MKLTLLLFFIFSIYLHADAKYEMFQLYKTSQYQKACTMGYDYFKKFKRDAQYASLYGFSCLKSDYIDRLAQPIATLKFSKEARENSAYFATILMQKKLLYHSLLDGYDLSKFKFPTTTYVLSKVFDLYSQLPKHKQKEFYILQDPDNKSIIYKLYTIKDNNIDKMVIEEYYDTIKVKRHIYW